MRGSTFSLQFLLTLWSPTFFYLDAPCLFLHNVAADFTMHFLGYRPSSWNVPLPLPGLEHAYIYSRTLIKFPGLSKQSMLPNFTLRAPSKAPPCNAHTFTAQRSSLPTSNLAPTIHRPISLDALITEVIFAILFERFTSVSVRDINVSSPFIFLKA